MPVAELLKLNNIKLTNTLAAVNTLRLEESLSRVEMAEKLSCDGTAITRITRDLIAKGVLESAGMAEPAGGRPREQIRLNAGWKNAIGIELSPGYITGALVDLKGKVLIREQIHLSGKLTRQEFVDSLETIARRLLESCEKEKLLGIGIASFGSFSGEDKILENVAAYPALEKFDIGKFFVEKFGIVPEITDATYAKALYEIWFNNAAQKGTFLLFDVGAGIGCVTAIEGKVVFGRYSCSGEFGHTIYKIDGDRCGCGRRGCLETLCSIGAIEKKVNQKTAGHKFRFDDIARNYASGDKQYADIVEDCAKWLGVAIANQINFLIPDEVVVTGDMLQLGNGFYKQCMDTVREYVFPEFMSDVFIRKSESWDQNATLGAASLLVRNVFENIGFYRFSC